MEWNGENLMVFNATHWGDQMDINPGMMCSLPAVPISPYLFLTSILDVSSQPMTLQPTRAAYIPTFVVFFLSFFLHYLASQNVGLTLSGLTIQIPLYQSTTVRGRLWNRALYGSQGRIYPNLPSVECQGPCQRQHTD